MTQPDIVTLIEYAGTASSIIGGLYIANQRSIGFWWWILANAALLTVAATHGLHGMVILYIYFTGTAIYSVWKWNKKTPPHICQKCKGAIEQGVE